MQRRISLGSRRNVQPSISTVDVLCFQKLFHLKQTLNKVYSLPPPWRRGEKPLPGSIEHDYHELLDGLFKRKDTLQRAVDELETSSQLAEVSVILGLNRAAQPLRKPTMTIDMNTGVLRFVDYSEEEKEMARTQLLTFFVGVLKRRQAMGVDTKVMFPSQTTHAPVGSYTPPPRPLVRTGNNSSTGPHIKPQPVASQQSQSLNRQPSASSSTPNSDNESIFSVDGCNNETPFTTRQNSYEIPEEIDVSQIKYPDLSAAFNPLKDEIRSSQLPVPAEEPSQHSGIWEALEQSHLWGGELESQVWGRESPTPQASPTSPPLPPTPPPPPPRQANHSTASGGNRVQRSLLGLNSNYEIEQPVEDVENEMPMEEVDDDTTDLYQSEEGGIRLDGQLPNIVLPQFSPPRPFVHHEDIPSPLILSPNIESFDFDDSSSELDGALHQHVFEEYELSLHPRMFQLPFWAQYEATRVALECNPTATPLQLEAEISASPLFERLMSACSPRSLEFDAWNRALNLLTVNKYSRRFGSISKTLFTSLQRQGFTENVQMSGEIRCDWDKSRDPLNIYLNPLKWGRSSRYFRKFGSDRFMSLNLPNLEGSKAKQASRGQQVFEYMMRPEGFKLMGRIWKGLYLKDGKSIIMFATKGEGISDITLSEVVQWHIQLNDKNLDAALGKLYTRMSLAFTDSVATVVFKKSQICPDLDALRPRPDTEPYEPDADRRSPINKVMNDGCHIASPAVFREIQQILKLETVPTAVQGRLGGAKGLWVVCPDTLNMESTFGPTDEKWIFVNESQQKYAQHVGGEEDEAWTTLDVVGVSKMPHQSNTNRQLIPILAHAGVPYTALTELLAEHLDIILKKLRASMADVSMLRHFIYDFGRLNSARASSEITEYIGGLPENDFEKMIMLLDSGFHHERSHYMKSLLTGIMEKYWKFIREKTRINIPRSTHVYCVADPTGTLEEGQVFLQFSDAIKDERSGRNITRLEGDILVARNPAHLPSDIQKVKAVYNMALRELQNVIVFSTKGDIPLAHLLSGGDYDGDEVWVCWDERLTQPFNSYEGEIPEFREQDWFYPRNGKSVRDLADELPNPDDHDALVEAFLRKGAEMSMTSSASLLGHFCKIHERYTYQKGHSITDDVAIELAQVCSHLVDAPKQGLYLLDNYKKTLAARFRANPINPNYQDSSEFLPHYTTTNRWEYDEEPWHVLDKLHEFGQEKIQAEEKKFMAELANTAVVDEDLTQLWKDEQEVARDDKNSLPPGEKSELWECLQRMKFEIKKVYDKWTAGNQEYKGKLHAQQVKQQFAGGYSKRSLPWSSSNNDSTYTTMVRDVYDAYQAILPIPEGGDTPPPKNHLVRKWARDAHRKDSEWQLLKASCAFYNYNLGKFVWNMAAEQLCVLKSRSVQDDVGGRHVIGKVLWTLRSDRRILERVMENFIAGEEGEDEADEELGFRLPVW